MFFTILESTNPRFFSQSFKFLFLEGCRVSFSIVINSYFGIFQLNRKSCQKTKQRSVFLNPIFSNLNSNCSNLLDMRNLQEQVKGDCSDLFTVGTNCSCDLNMFANSWPSTSNLKKKSRSLQQFFSVGQNKIQFL